MSVVRAFLNPRLASKRRTRTWGTCILTPRLLGTIMTVKKNRPDILAMSGQNCCGGTEFQTTVVGPGSSARPARPDPSGSTAGPSAIRCGRGPCLLRHSAPYRGDSGNRIVRGLLDSIFGQRNRNPVVAFLVLDPGQRIVDRIHSGAICLAWVARLRAISRFSPCSA